MTVALMDSGINFGHAILHTFTRMSNELIWAAQPFCLFVSVTETDVGVALLSSFRNLRDIGSALAQVDWGRVSIFFPQTRASRSTA